MADWARKAISQAQADAKAKQLGITTDQLYDYVMKVGDQSMFPTTTSGPTGGQFNAQSNPGAINWSKIDAYALQQKAQQTQAQQQALVAQGQQALAQQQAQINALQQTGQAGTSYYNPQTASSTMPDGTQPETIALQQMAQIDPTSEALRNALAASYLNPLSSNGSLTMPGAPVKGAPSAADLQSYLSLYGQIDPTGLAGRQTLEQQLTSQAALGSQLDPETAREIEQQVRLGQTARGNVYGTPQLVQEAMTRGQQGLALQQQRQQALQSFLQSGQDVGSVAQNLYQQGNTNYLNQYQNYLNAWNAQQANQRANQGAALSYLTSGATPYQTGANYYDRATGASATAAQGGPSYNMGGGVSGVSGTTGSPSSYGAQTSQDASQMYQQMLQQYSMTPLQKNRTGAALGGAVSGAVAGIPLAAATYGGSIVGGALAGGLGGYYS